MGKAVIVCRGPSTRAEKEVRIDYEDYDEPGTRTVEVFDHDADGLVVAIHRHKQPVLSFALSWADADMLVSALTLRHHVS